MSSLPDDLYSLELIPLTKVKKADHLAVEGSDGRYYHHGIYIGDGDVIDYGAENKTITLGQGMICKKPLKEFVGGDMVYRVKYNEKGLEKDPEDMVRTAVQLYEDQSCWRVYNLLNKNCEHFASFCKTGKPSSLQVMKKIKEFFTAVAAASAASSGMSSFSGI